MANTKIKLYSDFSDSPSFLREFLYYMQTIRSLSIKTVEAYYIDLKLFFRFVIQKRDNKIDNLSIDEVDIKDLDINFIKSISQSDILEFLYFVTNERNNSTSARARKLSSIRSFFKYCVNKVHIVKDNPSEHIELPSNKKRLPKYLSLEQAIELLSSINTKFTKRDYCMIVLLLNCGMRLSELVGIDVNDINNDTLRIIGKGNKERIVYLNDSCINAIEDYLIERNKLISPTVESALFISTTRKTRLSARRVQQIIEDCLRLSGLSNMGFSTHKLRHTAATLLYRSGNADMLALKEILGHEHVSTTEIYTHISDEALKKAAKSSPLSKYKRKSEEE